MGLWGPAGATLIPRAGEFDTARGVADKAVCDNDKLMTQRARREDVRPIVSEQAAFSADREQLCRMLATDPNKLNVDIHRVRKQFDSLGIQSAAGIVERRADTSELRIGVGSVEVFTL